LELGAAAVPLTTNKALTGSSIRLQADAGNSAEIYVGGYSDVAKNLTASATDFAVRIPAPNAAGDPAPPLPWDPWNKGIQLTLYDIWVFAASSGDKIAVSYWTN
jgi:hypothetical protein